MEVCKSATKTCISPSDDIVKLQADFDFVLPLSQEQEQQEQQEEPLTKIY